MPVGYRQAATLPGDSPTRPTVPLFLGRVSCLPPPLPPTPKENKMGMVKENSIVTWCIVTGEGGGRGQGNKERKERREKFCITFVDEVVE